MKGTISKRGRSFRVRYYDPGRKREIHKSFRSYEDAEIFQAHLTVSRDEGVLDARDYQKDAPLGFSTLADKWLERKARELRCIRNPRGHMRKAKAFFQNRNVKRIGFAEFDDFLISLPQGLSGKSKNNILATLHSFWTWLSDREGLQVPKFPKVAYTLGWRNTVDKETQAAIIEEVKRISYLINPRIWFGILLLASYPKVRPGELIQIQEKDIDRKAGFIWLRHTKEDRIKRIFLLDEDTAFIRTLPQGLPDMPFFRHGRRKGVASEYKSKYSGRFGKDYLYSWWKQACRNLGIEGVDLYGGTKHSTVTALREHMTPEEIRRYATEHHSNQAFDRYLHVDAAKQRQASRIIRSGPAHIVPIRLGQEKSGN